MLAIHRQANADLHLHPFLGRNSFADVIETMRRAGLHIIAPESLDEAVFPLVKEQAKRYDPNSIIDTAGVRLSDGPCILCAREYSTREGFHLLTIGYSADDANPQTEIRKIIDEALAHGALVILAHPFVSIDNSRIVEHISYSMEEAIEKLCQEYSGQMALEWNAYCIPWVRRLLKPILNIAGSEMRYHDVNEKAERLSAKLEQEGYNLPLIAGSDIHARNWRQLRPIGQARIVVDVEGETALDILASMKANIFERKHRNVTRYVSTIHLFEGLLLPIMIPATLARLRR